MRDLVAEYRKRRANEYNLKPNTVAEYERHLAELIDLFGDVAIRDLDVDHVHAFLGKCPPGSLPSRYSVVAAMFRWAYRDLQLDIAWLVPSRKPERRWRTRYLSSVEFVTIWTWIDERERKPRARFATLDAIRLGMICPLRRGEIASLAVQEVDLEGRRLYLHDTKSGNRVVPLSPIACAVCRRRMMSATQYLFPARAHRGHIGADSLSHAWCRIVRACGVPDATLHDCRRTWASHALRTGVSLEYVRRVLGHSTEWMSIKYAHVACEELQEAVDNVEAALVPTKVRRRLMRRSAGGGHDDG